MPLLDQFFGGGELNFTGVALRARCAKLASRAPTSIRQMICLFAQKPLYQPAIGLLCRRFRRHADHFIGFATRLQNDGIGDALRVYLTHYHFEGAAYFIACFNRFGRFNFFRVENNAADEPACQCQQNNNRCADRAEQPPSRPARNNRLTVMIIRVEAIYFLSPFALLI